MTYRTRSRAAAMLLAGLSGLGLIAAASAQDAPAPPAPPAPPVAPVPPAPPAPPAEGELHKAHKPHKVYKIVRRHGDDGKDPVVLGNCTTSKRKTEVDSRTTDDDGKVTRSHVIVCGDGIDAEVRAKVLEGLREARNDLAGDSDLPDEHRAGVLAELDREIARIESERDRR